MNYATNPVSYTNGSYYRKGSRMHITTRQGEIKLPVGFDYDYSSMQIAVLGDKLSINIKVVGWSDEVPIRKINPERLSDFVHTANWPVGIYELSGTLYAMDGTSKDYTETIIIKERAK